MAINTDLWTKVIDESSRISTGFIGILDSWAKGSISTRTMQYASELLNIDVCTERAKLFAESGDIDAMTFELSMLMECNQRINNNFPDMKNANYRALVGFAHNKYREAIIGCEQVLARREAA